MYRTGALIVAVLLHCTVLIPAAWAEAGEPRIGELSALDRQYMAQQRDLIEDITLRRLGRDFSGDRERDLALLQDMLDKRLVDASQTRELQAMGMILGEHLADALDMHWVIYEDALGRSRALQYADTDNYLFPFTRRPTILLTPRDQLCPFARFPLALRPAATHTARQVTSGGASH